MITALETVRLIGSEFSEVSDETIEKWLELSKSLISAKKFGTTYHQALALLTAHRLKMAGYGDNSNGSIGDAMLVNSYSEGEASVSFAASQSTNLMADAELALTVYGLQFLTLRRSCIMSIISAGEA